MTSNPTNQTNPDTPDPRVEKVETAFWHECSDVPDLDTSRHAVKRAIAFALDNEATRSDEAFQVRVGKWMERCFTPEIIADKLERADRFIEEALELVQATGYSAERAHALVDYTFNRPKGEAFQEVGGVRVTLAALCNPHGIDEEAAAEAELARVWTKIEAIRAKQATKLVGSALPVPQATPSNEARLREALDALRPFAESIVIDPTKQRGERHWAICGKLTTFEDQLRAHNTVAKIDAALNPQGVE